MSEIRSNVHIGLHVKYPLFLSDLTTLEFSRQIFQNPQISNFMKIRPVRAELFHADGHDEGNSRFSQFCKRA